MRLNQRFYGLDNADYCSIFYLSTPKVKISRGISRGISRLFYCPHKAIRYAFGNLILDVGVFLRHVAS